MTGMWMFLLANNYGEIGYGMQLLSLIISVFLFLLFWASSDELPLFALIVLVITISFWHGIYVVSPSQIPDYEMLSKLTIFFTSYSSHYNLNC